MVINHLLTGMIIQVTASSPLKKSSVGKGWTLLLVAGFFCQFSEGKLAVIQFQGVVIQFHTEPPPCSWNHLPRTTRVSVIFRAHLEFFFFLESKEPNEGWRPPEGWKRNSSKPLPKRPGVCDQCHALHDAWRPWSSGHGSLDVHVKPTGRIFFGGRKWLTQSGF